MTTTFLLFIVYYFEVLHSNEISIWPSIENDHTKLQFILPEKLQKPQGYIHKDALFGYPGYSLGSLQAQVHYINSTACDRLSPQEDQLSPPQEVYQKNETNSGRTSSDMIEENNNLSPYVFLIQRGECNFVTKIRNSQHAGAKAVIIVDNKCLCSDHECLTKTHDTVCETTLPYMANDESAGDITIPSMMIRKSDGMEIIQELKKNKYVLVKFDWGIPSPDGRVEWTMWHSSWDEQSKYALEQLEIISEKLGHSAYLTPSFVSYNGSKVGCRPTAINIVDDDESVLPCGNMCTNKGRYCLLDPSPSHNQEIGASGSDVIIENLRRLCIWKYANTTDPGIGKTWWKYVNTFGKECSVNEETFKNKYCAYNIMEKYHIPKEEIENCMGPYGTDVDLENPLLEEQLRQQTELQLLRLPAIYVDGIHARGTIDGAGVLNMICAGYGVGDQRHSPPEVCTCVNQAPLAVMECVRKGGYISMAKAFDEAHSHGYTFGSVLSMLLMISGTVATVGYVYYKRSQRHMREQVRSILAEYMPLEDQSTEDDDMHEGLHPAARASLRSPRGYLPRKKLEDLDDDDV